MTTNGHRIEFNSKGVVCRGFHYGPESDDLEKEKGAPCVVMAHGFGGTIEMGLRPFAERFVEAGMHVLLFDYRHFGISDGEPRQLISVRRQHDDYISAINFARTLESVDPDRIALFGTSFSGGHVVKVAARDGRVAAVVSQCPMMDGFAALKTFISYAGLGAAMRLTLAGIYDVLRSAIGMDPYRLPVVGEPGTLSFMSTPDAMPGVRAIAPPDFLNEVCARIGLTLGSYRPGLKSNRLTCPILILICEKDSVAPAEPARSAGRRAGGNAVVRQYPIGHFDIYVGEDFERSVAEQVEFYTEHLK